MVAAAGDHSMAATAEGDVYESGNGEDILMLDRQHFDESRVVFVAADGFTSAAVTADGALYFWDEGDNPWRMGAEDAFGGSKVRMVAFGAEWREEEGERRISGCSRSLFTS